MIRLLFDSKHRNGWIAFKLKPFLYAFGFPVPEEDRQTTIQL